ncbi:hypothetical protein FisN_15Lh213 [Fistulifera solaris]|uniref:H15 domain-containing protein n=1 Tax=Fistulifera solaris TaxID=1519565 RepID=A0A1Z5JDM0_FISSO|nr:hypothetical protein FisN_15Lh213 [Fistulifera solaris]|eukprot:GAX12095.1 hypothetical protein FisN_15Lh213 [Fistulifera solaris]
MSFSGEHAESPASADHSTSDVVNTPTKEAHNENDENKDEPSAKKRKPAPGTASSLNRSYGQLIQEAIVALKDRTGSSQPAISKWILSNYPDLQDGAHFRRNLNGALKLGVKKEHFTKVKCSYKISSAYKAIESAKKKRLAAAKKKAKLKEYMEANSLERTLELNAKKMNEMEKKDLDPETREKMKAELLKKEEAAKRKAEFEAKAKERAERLRRRRFPMEDTKLHAEDKELNVKPPADVTARPYLPYFWHATVPPNHPSRLGKTSGCILQASKVDGLDSGSYGLVPDLLHVYHFFRGDVHFTGPNENEYHPIVPDFTLKNLIFAVEQVLNGNARKAKLIPPLISHLFVTCLQVLFLPPDTSLVTDKNELKLRREIREFLNPALSPTSWAEVCSLYMDAMERFYSTDASRDPTVLPALAIDTEYLLGIKETVSIPMTPAIKTRKSNGDAPENHVLPEGYSAYLGDGASALNRAHRKLARQDPWYLTAEELMALLRALTEDILATNATISDDLASREEEMQELLRAKRSADAKFRKVRLAFEGPKKPRKSTSENDGEENAENEASNNGKDKSEEPFKPTASKKEFETAKRAQQKASEAYEKGIRKLVARTEPVGYDRNFNALYCFRNDPEVLYIEEKRPPSGIACSLPQSFHFERRSWHIIDSTSLFESFVSSLDIRGKRENELYEELLGPPGAQQSLRRFIAYDDVKKVKEASSRVKEMEQLRKRLEAARVKCSEEAGRRSGRLVGQSEHELFQIEEELKALEENDVPEEGANDILDYDELTGLNTLRLFETSGLKDHRRTREVKISKTRYVPVLGCASLVGTGNIDGTGMVGMLVAQLLGLEELCESLRPWNEKGKTRSEWINSLEGTVPAWNSMASESLASGDDTNAMDDNSGRRDSLDSLGNGSSAKRRRTDSPRATTSQTGNAFSISSIIATIKQSLLDLEERAATITNAAKAAQDAELADDNMSVDASDDDLAEKEKLEKIWKRFVHRIKETPTKKYSEIRNLLVSAIGAARQAHIPDIVAKLRSALLLHHPNAAGECKEAAMRVLEDCGGYDPDEDEDYEEADDDNSPTEELSEDDIPSVLSLEAAILKSCLSGSDDASRADWIAAVKSAKTLSRVAALTTAFCEISQIKLLKICDERDALTDAIKMWSTEEEKKPRKKAKNGMSSSTSMDPSEVWTNVHFSDDICMAKVENYPWWPARKCMATDSTIAESLLRLDRSLVALVGEMGGLRVVKNDMLRPFTGVPTSDDHGEMSKEVRSQLTECVAMARRIMRGVAKNAGPDN